MPRDVVAEGIGLLGSRKHDRADRVGQLLGLNATVPIPDAETVKSRRAERERKLRQRIADATCVQKADAFAADQRAIDEHYRPLDASIAKGTALDEEVAGKHVVSWDVPQDGNEQCLLLRDEDCSCLLRRICAVTGSRETGVEEPCEGVFVFPLLSEDICAKIWAETECYLDQAADKNLPLPLRHDGCLDLSHIFPKLLHTLAEAAMPAVRALLPAQLHTVSLRHAFRTKNFVGREETFTRHVDKYAVTLNVCIRKTADVRGSGVFFFSDQTAADPVYRHEHAVGLAVLHSSKEWHQTEPLTAGERSSIIMWFDHGFLDTSA
eukprot:gnl/TRDRNA2_/TRDRNA2_124200_c0_seq1.p1 gnl/TRDRNA2_/TRDRNA2_124200_c0~~gnl/TRDRNA2_/TRDRNA2_124200_c0_seq1.p1  ORF type:complete len:322 (+),score=56.93 gnl/TRDRNA2_/TRDRNA2_124200_c0_seq1:2-967(+)